MRWATLAVFLLFAASVAADTRVLLTGATGGAEVCRFEARDAENPITRWLTPQLVTCVPSDAEVTFPPGLWNVFARERAAVSVDPILIDGASAPRELAISLIPAATVALHLAAETTAVVYAPKHGSAFPAGDRTTVPAGEELWLIVISKSVPVAVVPIGPLQPGTVRDVDARSPNTAPVALGWTHVPIPDRAAIRSARGVQKPRIAITAADKETLAVALPDPDALDGALVLFRGLSEGEANLQLEGRGWLPFRRSVRIASQLTLLREPIAARASATIIVNWSTEGDLAALERSLGACEPPKEAPRLELTISSCPEPTPGKPLDPTACTSVHREALRDELSFGSVRVDEVPPGLYRAELRFGRLPSVASLGEVLPLQQRPLALLKAAYFEAYGTLTRGGAPLGEDAHIEFPGGGVGFLSRDAEEYRAIVREPFGADARIEIATCRGKRSTVITDRPLERWRRTRLDIDIPDNSLTIDVVDGFTRQPLPAATLKYVVMSKRFPQRPLITRDVTQTGGEDSDAGRFVIKELPERELRLTVSCPGYKKKEIDPFSMTKSETKEIHVDLFPLGGSDAKVLSGRPFVNGTIFWFSAAGAETERADLAPDGAFRFERTHYRDETMVVVSLSHPLWILRAPAVERAKPLHVAFPDAAPQRDAQVFIANSPGQMMTIIGVAVGGLRVAQPALVQHLELRGLTPIVKGGGSIIIPGIAETGPIDVLRGPTASAQSQSQFMASLILRTFVPVATKRLPPGSATVIFDGPAR